MTNGIRAEGMSSRSGNTGLILGMISHLTRVARLSVIHDPAVVDHAGGKLPPMPSAGLGVLFQFVEACAGLW